MESVARHYLLISQRYQLVDSMILTFHVPPHRPCPLASRGTSNVKIIEYLLVGVELVRFYDENFKIRAADWPPFLQSLSKARTLTKIDFYSNQGWAITNSNYSSRTFKCYQTDYECANGTVIQKKRSDKVINQ